MLQGGADQGMPIIVSRVAPNTPADNSIPRLNEGDQVLFINGRDVSQHTHEQVIPVFSNHLIEVKRWTGVCKQKKSLLSGC